MAFTPTPGNVAILTVGSTPVTVPGMNWSIADDAKLKDVSNFRDGRATVDTLHDADLEFTLVWDSAANPTMTANGSIVNGAYLAVVNGTTSSGKQVSGKFQIGTVKTENPGLEDVLLYHVTGKLNGTLTYPST